jgi:hypothetical protein
MTQRILSARSFAARSASAMLLTAAMMALAGCEGTGSDISRDIGLTREAPDEFTVTTRAPLSMPPDFKILPPTPGAARPQERTARDSAELALSPQAVATTAPANRTAGERAFIGAAGPSADPAIRNEINQQAVQDANKRSFTDRLLFWKSKPVPGVIVDPARESQRLRQNDAIGQAPTAGNTPIIQPDARSGLLDRLF